MSAKKSTPSKGEGITVTEYCAAFAGKVLKGGYGETPEENAKKAGEAYWTLIKKLHNEGQKNDVAIPLRSLRDTITRVYFSGAKSEKDQDIETLFKLYDITEENAQFSLSTMEGSALGTRVLEDLRQRFYRLMVGETWEAYPELKAMAAKRVQAYAIKEAAGGQSRLRGMGSEPPPPTMARKFSKSLSMANKEPDSWFGVLDNLQKAPSGKLYTLLRLFMRDYALQGGDSALPSPTPTGSQEQVPQERTSQERTSLDRQSPRTSQLVVQKSDGSISTPVGSGSQSLQETNIDDLLGLFDDQTLSAPVPSNPAPSYTDPFQEIAQSREGPAAFQDQQQHLPPAPPTSAFGNEFGRVGSQGEPLGVGSGQFDMGFGEPAFPSSHSGGLSTFNSSGSAGFPTVSIPPSPPDAPFLSPSGSSAAGTPSNFNPFGGLSPSPSGTLPPRQEFSQFSDFNPISSGPAVPTPPAMALMKSYPGNPWA